MNLADELRGIPFARPMRGAPVRRILVEEDAAKVERRKHQARLRSKKHKLLNPDRTKETQRIYREKNKEKIAALKKAWRLANIERIRIYNAMKMREFRRANPEAARAKSNAWAKEHRDQLNAARRARAARKRQEAQ